MLFSTLLFRISFFQQFAQRFSNNKSAITLAANPTENGNFTKQDWQAGTSLFRDDFMAKITFNRIFSLNMGEQESSSGLLARNYATPKEVCGNSTEANFFGDTEKVGLQD